MFVHHRRSIVTTLFLLCVVLLPQQALAAGSGMPWEGPITDIIESLTGPVAQSIITGSILVLGISFSFSEGIFMRRILGVVFGGAIALGAASFALDLFGFTAGAVV